jgi:hypothetical protein
MKKLVLMMLVLSITALFAGVTKNVSFHVTDINGDEFDFSAAPYDNITFTVWNTAHPAEIFHETDPGAFHTDFANPNPGDGPSAVTCQIGAFATAWADNDTFTFWVRDETAGVGGYLDGQGTTDPVINDGAVHYDGWSGAIGGSQAAIQPIVASGIDSNMPLETSLEQNYPNPFNPTTTINFSIVEAGNVSMNVYNFSGQLVRSLVNGQMNAGMHTANFDASNLSAGVYYYTLEANNMTMTNKMILVK